MHDTSNHRMDIESVPMDVEFVAVPLYWARDDDEDAIHVTAQLVAVDFYSADDAPASETAAIDRTIYFSCN